MMGAHRFVLCAVLAFGGAACAAAHGGPVLGGNDNPAAVSGTISGIVRAATSTPLSARKVTAVNVDTGARHEATTAANGGYTLKVPMGKYRLEVELKANEALSESPGEIEINRSDLDSGRDFVVTVKP